MKVVYLKTICISEVSLPILYIHILILQYLENVSGYLWNVFFVCDVGYLVLRSVTILGYNWDALDTKSASISVHRAIGRNSKNIEP